MGADESKESEKDQIISYFKGKPITTGGHPFYEIGCRCLIKKSSEGRSVWAFNRTSFLSLKEGCIIGLYALLGLICIQEDQRKINILKKCLYNKVVLNCESDLSKKVSGAEKLGKNEQQLIFYAYDFLRKAIPKEEIDEIFHPGLGLGQSAVLGGAIGVGLGLVLGGFGIIFGLAFAGLYQYEQYKKREKRKENRKKNFNLLLESLRRFFIFGTSKEELEEKLKELEENNLFIIKINFSGSEGVRFQMERDDSISETCNFLPKKNTSEEKDLIRKYYKNLLILYRNFFDGISETKYKCGEKGDFFNLNMAFLKNFENEYNRLVIHWEDALKKIRDPDIVVPIRRGNIY